jgi:hypothetical protein
MERLATESDVVPRESKYRNGATRFVPTDYLERYRRRYTSVYLEIPSVNSSVATLRG